MNGSTPTIWKGGRESASHARIVFAKDPISSKESDSRRYITIAPLCFSRTWDTRTKERLYGQYEVSMERTCTGDFPILYACGCHCTVSEPERLSAYFVAGYSLSHLSFVARPI